MALSNQYATDPVGRHAASSYEARAQESAASWSAILGGAAAIAALSLILLMLGTGLGLTAVSPWTFEGITATTFGIATIVWVIFTQFVACATGGYIAGRLRTKWTDAYADEVYFRDTVHGFLAWAVAALVTAALLTSVMGAIVGAGVQAGTTMAGGAVSAATTGAMGGRDETTNDTDATVNYFVDMLFRTGPGASPQPTEDQPTAIASAEVARVFMHGLRVGTIPPEDVRYVGQIVAQRTGMGQQEAEARVVQTFETAQRTLDEAEATAREAADTAREAAAYGALWIFISLLVGAFSASLAATYGGRQRDA
jgi:hypothetical protein